jgi:hypothetical protein
MLKKIKHMMTYISLINNYLNHLEVMWVHQVTRAIIANDKIILGLELELEFTFYE